MPHITPSLVTTTWWRHQMETFYALLALCAGNSLVAGEFPSQRPVTRSFDVFYDLRRKKRLSKQSKRWWFETSSCSLWRHRNEVTTVFTAYIMQLTLILGYEPKYVSIKILCTSVEINSTRPEGERIHLIILKHALWWQYIWCGQRNAVINPMYAFRSNHRNAYNCANKS